MNQEIRNEEELEKSLSLKELVFLLKKNIILVIVLIGVCVIVGGIYGIFFKENSYSATTSTMLMVDDKKEGTSTTTEYSNYMYSTQLISTYKDFIVSRTVIESAVKSLEGKGYEISYQSVKRNLTVDSQENSLVVYISYTANGDEKYQEAIDVVNAIVDTAINIVNTEKTDDGKLKYFILSNSIATIDPAISADAKRGTGVIIAISFFVGVILALGFVLIKHISDDTYKSKEDIKRVFGLDVIATIPDLSSLKGDGANEE